MTSVIGEKHNNTTKGWQAMRLKQSLLAGTAAGSLLLLAACGGSGDGPGSGSDGPGNDQITSGGDTGDGTDPEREGPVTIEGAQEGGTVTLLSNDGVNSLDPSEAYYTNTLSILNGLVTRSLTQYVYDEEAQQAVLVPDLATDLGTPNEDFTEWEFTIREGVRWQNGDEVTAEDVAYGIKRSFDRQAFPEGPAFSNDYFVDGDSYRGPYKSGEDYDGITVEGSTITISMSKPFPDMPYWGSFPAMGAIPQDEEINDPATYARNPWSNGPYMFEEYTPEQSLTLVRNPEWDPDTDPGRTQYPDEYVFDFATESAQIDQLLLQDSGNATTTLSYDDILAENYPSFLSEASDRMVTTGTPCTFYWAPDYRKVTDINVRRALAFAYPYEAALQSSGNIEGVNRIFGTNLMPPGIPGREEYQTLEDEGFSVAGTDPEKARELLAEAGEEGFEIRFLFANDDPLSVAVKDTIVEGLEEAGFTATPVATTIANTSTERADPDADINVRSAGWCSDWPSGSSWFPPLTQSTNLDEEGLGSNYAVFSEEEVDTRIEDILNSDLDDQPAAWNELDKYISDTYFPMFVTSYTGTSWAHGSDVEGVRPDGTSGLPDWKNIHVAQ